MIDYDPRKKTKSAKFHIVQQSEHVYDSDVSVEVIVSMIDDIAPSINISVNYGKGKGLLGNLNSSLLDCFAPL